MGAVSMEWHRISPGPLEADGVTTVVAGGRALCVTRTSGGYGVLDNRCPHDGQTALVEVRSSAQAV